MTERYDAVVIGAGQAGPALCARLDREGLKTAIIERKLVGGTCVNVGCIPTKTLVASARAAHVARRGGEYGFAAGEVRVDMKAVKARKDAIVAPWRDEVERSLKTLPDARSTRAMPGSVDRKKCRSATRCSWATRFSSCGRPRPGAAKPRS